jgi:RHS repeat-associated protein
VYVFDARGRHLRTLEALTGALRHRFDYDTQGRLSSITDGDGLMTRVERDVEGKPVAIVAPHGQRTRLTLDARGYLASTTNPADETVHVTHSPDGLLTTMRDARGGLHTYAYDDMGRLRKDTNPAGGHKGLVRTQASDGSGYTVAFSTTLGASTLYETQQLPQGGQKRIITAPDGTTTVRQFGTDGTTATTAPDGTVTTEMEGPDARFGMQAPLLASQQVRLPGGLTFTSSHRNTVTYVNGDTSNGIATLSDTLTRNGRAFVATYAASTRTLTTKSPEGRLTTSTLDEKGRLVRQEVPGVLPVEVSYDVEGRPWKVTRGDRTQTHTYNASGYLEKVEDALGRTTSFSYNPAGRLTSQQLPGGRTVGLSFDAHGNLTQLVPPGRPAHAFLYTPTDTTASYTPPPPFASTPMPSTQYAYDMDGALTSTTLPDGSSVQVARDGAGRVDFLTTPRTTVDFDYDAQGRLSALADSTGPSLAYAYDGPLVKRVTWSGGVQGSVGYTYTSDFTLGTLTVQGESFTYGYDNDGLLTSAGALSLVRRADNGLLSSTTLGQVTTGQQYTPHGDVQTLSAAFESTSLYSLTLGRDAAGRIISKTEVAQGVTHEWGYTYDVAGRLHTVTLDGAPHATYGYDANGNRTSLTQGSSALTATYDAQDRLQTHGATSYTFGPNGDLQQRLRPPEVAPTQYTYDALGALTHVRLPDGTQVDYVVDALGRRVGKRLNATRVQGFLYDGSLRVVAELDGTGAMVSRFVYASLDHVPDYMVKGSTTYRLLTDHLGSVRLVVNTSTGMVVQALEYGPFGEVLVDSNPGFQPFGFAGGLYDRDTQFLRFGARDYDAEVGRWTSKDPIHFHGGDTNLFAYVGSNPVEDIDPTGLMRGPRPYESPYGRPLYLPSTREIRRQDNLPKGPPVPVLRPERIERYEPYSELSGNIINYISGQNRFPSVEGGTDALTNRFLSATNQSCPLICSSRKNSCGRDDGCIRWCGPTLSAR